VREVLARFGVTGLGLLMLAVFLLPLAYVLATAFKLDTQVTTPGAPLYPASAATYTYEGAEYPLYDVPTEDGGTRRLAVINPFRETSDVVDPAHPEQGVFNIEGRWRTWKAIYSFDPELENFTTAWRQVKFLRLFRNSFLLSGISTIGTLIACILVAYGFTRFQLPGKNILFVILISTIVLPPQATIIPLYILFSKLGWIAPPPLLVLAFLPTPMMYFCGQYFMSIPRN
jgi:multiple sugar transport system permease protein